MSRLLEGVRVVEFGILFNGDTLGMLLGDLGADVIKVEHPRQGDYLREMHGHLAPHWSPTHIQANKNKRSIGLDVRVEAGREVFIRLIRGADVFVDGLSTGACDRMGVGYAMQRQHNPQIIYCQHRGFGATGPYAALPTHGVSVANSEYERIDPFGAVLRTTAGVIPFHPCAICSSLECIFSSSLRSSSARVACARSPPNHCCSSSRSSSAIAPGVGLRI